MVKALQIAIEKSSMKGQEDNKAVATWIKSFDRLLGYYDVFPVTWEIIEEDGKFIYSAWIPADCLTAYEEAAEFISETYNDLVNQTEED